MSSNSFNTVQLSHVKSNVFDLSYDHKLSLKLGTLVPVHTMEVIPGDIVKMGSDSLLRMAPMVAPVMHNVNVTMHHFFVPNRLVWPNWEKFITGGEDPQDSPALPHFNGMEIKQGDLANYLGLPIFDGAGLLDQVSALPFAAYQLIYDSYYRDQNLQDEVFVPLIDGQQSSSDYITRWNVLRKRAWQHDYFTAALPFAQKGPAVSLPIGNFSDVTVEKANNNRWHAYQSANGGMAANGAPLGVSNLDLENSRLIDAGSNYIGLDPNGSLVAKTSTMDTSAATINNLRVAFRLQEWFERNARGGSRYIESILSHFGVRSSDARLNRPEYLGGSRQPMVISEVLQTSESSATPQANMAGHGVSAGSGKNFKYRAEEHGYIISIMSIMPKTAYQQGIPRHFTKFDRLDYAWPTFAHLGEQAVFNREIYASNDGNNDKVFGYIPRYSEYRHMESRVSGEFQTSLSFWHMGRIFSTRPNLNSSFITADPTDRIFAVTDPNVDKVYAHVFHRIKAVRKLPKFGTPTF